MLQASHLLTTFSWHERAGSLRTSTPGLCSQGPRSQCHAAKDETRQLWLIDCRPSQKLRESIAFNDETLFPAPDVNARQKDHSIVTVTPHPKGL